MKKESKWKPIRRGGRFCSPACGYNCTYEDYQKVRKLALDTKKLLNNPKGWRVHVWENAGWHSCLEKGGLTLYIHTYVFDDKPTYSVLFSRNSKHAGEVFWSLRDNAFSDPNKAIRAQMKVAREFIRECERAVEVVGEV